VNLKFPDLGIRGLVTVVPSNVRRFEDDMAGFAFSAEKSLRLKAVMGFDRHRIVEGNECASDLCVFGLRRVFDEGWADPAEIDALILVTQSPDHFLPPTSNLIQARVGLSQDCLCLDINQGCAGYLLGLIEAALLLGQEEIRTVALLTADTLSRRVSRRDRSAYPISGDAAAVTIVTRNPGGKPVHANVKMDGSRASALMIPAGGFRMPSSPETAALEDCGDGNLRSRDDLAMDGTAVFNFVQSEVPPMIDDLLLKAGAVRDDVDFFVFHQPNRFMLEKLADKLKVPRARVPSNVVEAFGNASSVTIPTNICHNLRDRLLAARLSLCLAGFGAGLSWSSMLIDVGPLAFCEIVEFPETA
jgi:3-oxoacyl-[acyl-carrier-protein] synthase-3